MSAAPSRPAPRPDAPPAHASRAAHAAHWAPLALVAATLAVLAAEPFAARARARELRGTLDEVVEPARVLVNDVEAAVAMQLYALGELSQWRGAAVDAARARSRAARAAEAADEAALDTLTRRLGPPATALLGELRTRAATWHESAEAGPTARGDALTLAGGTERSAERLEQWLTTEAALQRARVRAVERWDRYVPLGLVPVALAAMAVVWWANRRLFALAAEADAGRRRLEASAVAREALMRGVTHDVKNPLGAALGYAQLLVNGVLGPITEPQRDVAVRLRRLLQLALGTVTDLVELSRAQAGQLAVATGPVDLGDLAREAVEDYRAAAQAADLTLTAVDAERPWPAVTDAARVRQILGNLISNALKYTPAGGRVWVELAAAGADAAHATAPSGDTAILVRDTGPGVPPAMRDRVFEEFFRVPDQAAAASGAGVGLAIARRVARLLGGDLTLAAAAGGACFVLTLPATPGGTLTRRSSAPRPARTA